MNGVLTIDQQLFFLINHLPHGWIFDQVALFLSGVGTAGIIWVLVGFFLFLREEKRDHRFWLPLFLSGAGAWFFSEIILKPLIGRPRPLEAMGAIIIGEASGDPSFPSAHATIAFAMAVVLSQKAPRRKWMFYLLAILISLSRLYLGKHYPLDVIVGAFVGIIIGWLSLMLGSFAQRKLTRL